MVPISQSTINIFFHLAELIVHTISILFLHFTISQASANLLSFPRENVKPELGSTIGDVMVPIVQSTQLTFCSIWPNQLCTLSILSALYNSSSIAQPSKFVRENVRRVGFAPTRSRT
jgi:hypothetical protein